MGRQGRLEALAAYRAAGNDWSRHKPVITGEEHDLGVWLHSQRFKQRRGQLDADKAAALDAAVPGWRTGRKRGRQASSRFHGVDFTANVCRVFRSAPRLQPGRCYARDMTGHAMSPDGADLSADMEMTTKEAAAYLSGPVGFTLSTKIMYGLRSVRRGPVAEKRGSRLVYRKSALDAFLRENGTDIMAWTEGMWRDVADQLRVISEVRPDLKFGPLIETLDERDQVDWDPDQAK